MFLRILFSITRLFLLEVIKLRISWNEPLSSIGLAIILFFSVIRMEKREMNAELLLAFLYAFSKEKEVLKFHS